MRTIHLYRFRYFDTMRNKWLTARYAAQRQEIAQRYAQHELIEPPEVRHVAEDCRYNDASRVGAGHS